MNKLHLGLLGILSALIGMVVLLLLDLGTFYAGLHLPMILRFVLLVLAAGAAFLAGRKSLKRVSGIFIFLSVLAVLIVVIFNGCVDYFTSHSDYQDTDIGNGVKSFFSEQTVMLIVPHQDDELNVMGGTIEEYVRHGSEVYVVYLTNGDAIPAEIRLPEAINCMAKQNIPEDHVIFLGYGDQWQDGNSHLYNAEAGEIMRSKAGFLATYGIEEHPAYREGTDYTVENMLADMESVILEYRPDVIFCSDYDPHVDHKATSLAFEKVMGQILKKDSGYRPRIFKGFSYRTSWANTDDFYHLNIRSTTNNYEDMGGCPVEHYRWNDRIRFPVIASRLSRSLPGSGFYDLLESHVSQDAQMKAEGVINGDKVFWERETSSLCYRAEIEVSSGEGNLLNDFMLLESNDVTDLERWPCDGTWQPEATDSDKRATVILPEKSDLTKIVLYDNPEPGQDVLQAVITFDNGEQIETGPLDPYGSANVITVDQKQVACFDVKLTSTEGTSAGLTEIEAFADAPEKPRGFIQLMDQSGDFVYDYITDPSGELLLQVYHYGTVPELTPENYTVSCDNEKCSAAWTYEGLAVLCPPGEMVTVSVVSAEEGIWDQVYIQNPGILKRSWIEFGQHGEILKEEMHKIPGRMKKQVNLWTGGMLQQLDF